MSLSIFCIVLVSAFLNADAAHLRSVTNKIYIGTIAESSYLSESSYKTIAGQEFDAVTPENSMKWDAIEGTRGQPHYTGGDAVVAFAQQNQMKVRGHNLIWHAQIPSWLNSLSKTDLESAMKKHITDVVTHYKGKIYAWDVLNEIFNEDGTLRDSIWHKNFGSAYIAEALKTAHEADPDVKLYINDYNVEGKNRKSDGLYKLAQELKAQGAPIHGVGIQAHLGAGRVPQDLKDNMDRFSALGLDVAITELDISIQMPASADKFAQQAKDYAAVFHACLAVQRCVGVSLWGLTDKHSWISNGDPLPWDANYQPKAAVAAIEAALKG